MKLAERNHVVLEVGSFASSDKVSSAEDVSNQPQNAVPQLFPIEFAGDDHVSFWTLVTSYHTRNRSLDGGHVNPSSRKVNHRFNKRTTCPQLRGENDARRNDPAFLSSRKEKSTANAKVGRQQARFRVILLPPKAASPTLPVSPPESQKCCPPTPLVAATTSSQGGKVPFVSLWRLLYGMLFAMLLQLDLCGAAAVVAGTTHPPPPPPPRHTLWKDLPGAGAIARDVPAAPQMHSPEQLRLRGHKEGNSAPTSSHAALNNFQEASTNSPIYSWQLTSAPSGIYEAIACSDSGQHVVAGNYHGYLYTSNDYGATWNQSLSVLGYYHDVASSSDGQYWAAVSFSAGIYTSNDYGNSWSLSSAAPIGWYSIASSADGKFLSAATYGGSIYTSNNNGQTWDATSAVTAAWLSIDSSDSGHFLAAVAWDDGVYMSSDYGVTWTKSSFFQSTMDMFMIHEVTVSRTGQYLAVLTNGKLFTSSNYGYTWIDSNPSMYMNWQYFTASGSGHIVVGNRYDFHISEDYGATWVSQSVPSFLVYGATLSSDGLSGYGVESNSIYRMTSHDDSIPSAAPTTAVSTNGQSVIPTSLNTCPGGTFNAQPGQPTSQCAVCPGGTYSTEGMNSCLSCPAGTFSTAWSSSCTECPAGFYCLFGASTAVMCPSGTISTAGASSCTACTVGQYSYPGSSTCLTCSAA